MSRVPERLSETTVRTTSDNVALCRNYKQYDSAFMLPKMEVAGRHGALPSPIARRGPTRDRWIETVHSGSHRWPVRDGRGRAPVRGRTALNFANAGGFPAQEAVERCGWRLRGMQGGSGAASGGC